MAADYSAAAAYSPVADSSAAVDYIVAAEDKEAVIQGYTVAAEDSFVVAEDREAVGNSAVAEATYMERIVALDVS